MLNTNLATEKQIESVSRPQMHLSYLDGLRASAALYVILYHAQGQMNITRTGLLKYASALVGYGHFAVGLFIVLSGYCLALPVVRGDGTLQGGALNFFKKRAKRILPPYYMTVLCSLLLIQTLIGIKTGTVWDNALPITASGIVTHLLLVQDAFGSSYSQINHSLWSISVEWRIYFLFPLLVRCWQRIGAIISTTVTVVLSFIALLLLPRLIGTALTVQYVGLFALGMLGAGIVFSQTNPLLALRRRVPWTFLAISNTILLFGLSRFKIINRAPMPETWLDYFVGLTSMCLLVAAGISRENWIHKTFAWKPLAFIGTFSYSIYLIHAPLLQLLWQYVFRPMGLKPVPIFLLQCTLGMAVIIVISFLFFLAFEKPFLNVHKAAQVSAYKGTTDAA